MNALTISKREELCRNLNMNFDEASELFSDETLESMLLHQDFRKDMANNYFSMDKSLIL